MSGQEDRGGAGLRASGDDDREDSAKPGDFFLQLCLAAEDICKRYIAEFFQNCFSHQASVMKGQNRPVNIGYWQDSN